MKYWIILLTFIYSVVSNSASIPDDFKSKLESYLNTQKFVGLSILVLTKDGQEFVSHYGSRDLEKGLSPDDDTLYEIGSITKSFARIALATQNKVKLKDKLSSYLPSSVRVPRPSGEEITIENLVTHTGIKFSVPCTIRLSDPRNLKCYGVDLDEHLTDPYRNTSKENNYKFLTEYSFTLEEFPQIFAAPGTFWSYSNIGIGLLGEILGEQFNTSFEDYLKNSVLTPLGMSDTKITMPCESTNSCKNLAKVYTKEDLTKKWKQASLWHLPGLAAAGGMRSSIKDMKKFLQANLNPKHSAIRYALEVGQSPLLDASKLHNSNICAPGEQQYVDLCNPRKKEFYYAWEAVPNGSALFHGGATGASHAMMIFSMDRSVGAVVLSNSKVGKGEQSLFHYPNDVALCAFQLLGKNIVPGFDFCSRIK